MLRRDLAMTTLQFTLFFVALVLALALVHIQLAKLQGKLDDLARLGRIEDRLATVVQALDRVRLEPIEGLVRDLRGDLGAIVEGLDRVEQATARPVAIPVPEPALSRRGRSDEPSAGDRARTAVETHLAGLGYTKVRVLSDLTHLVGEEDVDVLVECERGTMPCKGKLALRGGEVRDAQMQMLAQMFP